MYKRQDYYSAAQYEADVLAQLEILYQNHDTVILTGGSMMYIDAVSYTHLTKLGYINHVPLVWDNEPARHKLLDIIGDLALIGKPIKGRFIATRPGHTNDNKCARQTRKEIKLHEIQAPVSYTHLDVYKRQTIYSKKSTCHTWVDITHLVCRK